MTERRVRTARLRASSENAARRAGISLADALRTASLHDAETRVILIRSLRLGTIHADGAPSTVALALERATRACLASVVHASQPAARGANAVWFRDATEALMLLAVALARGDAAWYWPLVLPGWKPAVSGAESLRTLLLHVAARESGTYDAVMVLDALVRAGHERDLLAALRVQDAEILLERAHWQAAPSAGGEPDIPVHEDRRIAQWAAHWPRGDARTQWLACARVAAHRSSLLADARLGARAAALLDRLDSATEDGIIVRDPAYAEEMVGALERNATTPASVPVQNDGAGVVHDLAERETDASALWSRAAEPSEAAGLLFVVSMLRLLHLEAVFEEDASLLEADWPLALLGVVARALRMDDADPVARAFPRTGPEPAHRDRTAHWLRTLRRTSRSWLGRPLRSVVRRRGRIATTRTHIDVLFSLAQVDLDIRRAGLDIDPGWVPWLGRIVRFHYLSPDE